MIVVSIALIVQEIRGDQAIIIVHTGKTLRVFVPYQIQGGGNEIFQIVHCQK
jgi:hypothetical protein